MCGERNCNYFITYNARIPVNDILKEDETMKRFKVENEAINGFVHALEYDIMDLLYTSNDLDEDERSDMEIVVLIHDRINDILTEVSNMEAELNKMKEKVALYRKLYGDQFIADCDRAGIK